MKLSDFPHHVQEKLKDQMRRDDIRSLEARFSKRPPLPTLDKGNEKLQRSEICLELCVEFCVYLRRRMDSDNLIGSLKPLRDAIAQSIGIDDGDPRIRWEYAQAQVKHTQGVSVIITVLEGCSKKPSMPL